MGVSDTLTEEEEHMLQGGSPATPRSPPEASSRPPPVPVEGNSVPHVTTPRPDDLPTPRTRHTRRIKSPIQVTNLRCISYLLNKEYFFNKFHTWQN